jgi:hypothetical protein
MSRTRKDAPEARKSRAARRFADREIPFGYTPNLISWDELAEAAQTDGTRARRLIALLAAPCPHYGPDGGRINCSQAAEHQPVTEDLDVLARAELTSIANGF